MTLISLFPIPASANDLQWKSLTFIANSSILDVTAVLDPSLSLFSQKSTKSCKSYASISLIAQGSDA